MTQRAIFIFTTAVLILGGALFPGPAQSHAVHHGGGPSAHAPGAAASEPGKGRSVPLYDNLGSHRYPVTTDAPLAQRYFDQGLRLYYAFNHDEAVLSFREAQRLDPSCALCWWGEGLALGPNINLPMDAAAAVEAYAATRRALTELDDESDVERALVRALAERYEAGAPTDRARLDSAYARALAEVVRRFPDDVEPAVLHAESLMDLSPWNYWTEEGEPRPGTEEALSRLEWAMERNPEHPGACHFYIHAVEAVDPDRAIPCAERLADLMPGAGHLVHMPGHIYIRVGRFADAIRQNEHAVHADETWIQDRRPGVSAYTAGYYPHNYDFMAFAAAMAGMRERAVEAVTRVQDLVPLEMVGETGMSFLQHWYARPYLVHVRFGLWKEILELPKPPEGLMHARALWHYARGRAFAATGRVDEARGALVALRTVAASPSLEAVRMEFNLSTDLLDVAERVLAAHVAEAQGELDRAVARLRQAAELEDELTYGEPPEWTVPVRHDLGAALLAAGRPAEAERVYREDLERFRENGWSLFGLMMSLEDQGRSREADEVARRLDEAWKDSDVTLTSSRF